MAATNKDLKQAIARGEFREDLFYRLNVINISVPPLREREGDVDLLVKHFMSYYGKKIGRRIRNLDANFKSFVKTYHWPGNVRELQNLIERAAILTDSDVLSYDDIADTPLSIASPPAAAAGAGNQPLTVEDYIQHIVKTLPVDPQRDRARADARHRPQGALGPPSALGDGAQPEGVRDQGVTTQSMCRDARRVFLCETSLQVRPVPAARARSESRTPPSACNLL